MLVFKKFKKSALQVQILLNYQGVNDLPGTEEFNPETDKVHFMNHRQVCVSQKKPDGEGFEHKIFYLESE